MKILNRQSGVTLNEVIISISVVAILLAAAAPSYSEFVSKRKVAVAANMVGMFFENVKMESIKRNEFATISYKKASLGTGWCLGAVIGRESACDCMAETPQCVIDSVPTVLSNETYAEFNDLLAAFQEGSISFDPVRGILTDPSDSVLVKIKHPDEDYEVNVSVNATGSVRKCSPADHKLVGYATCI